MNDLDLHTVFNLRRTRDLLLPRLVSGEVSVDQIELELEA